MQQFMITKNQYLKKDTIGYYHQYYTGYGNPDNPNFLNILKNQFNSESVNNLNAAMKNVIQILVHDLPIIIRNNNIYQCMLVAVPRAKANNQYSASQLMFKEAIKRTVSRIRGVTDGTDNIIRTVNTRTTHLRNAKHIINDGDDPYPGITTKTCQINKNKIIDQNIILIDDIYTRTINVVEDCIQALYDHGANKVIFYSIGYTRRRR